MSTYKKMYLLSKEEYDHIFDNMNTKHSNYQYKIKDIPKDDKQNPNISPSSFMSSMLTDTATQTFDKVLSNTYKNHEGKNISKEEDKHYPNIPNSMLSSPTPTDNIQTDDKLPKSNNRTLIKPEADWLEQIYSPPVNKYGKRKAEDITLPMPKRNHVENSLRKRKAEDILLPINKKNHNGESLPFPSPIDNTQANEIPMLPTKKTFLQVINIRFIKLKD